MAIQLTPEQQTAIRALDINDLTKRYIGLREAKQRIVEVAKDDIAKLDKGMEKLEVLMLCWLQLTGVESARTPSGTPYLTDKTGANMADRDAFIRFVAEDFANRNAFFTNALAKDTVKSYMDTHDGVPPPGVNWFSEKAVNFKK